MSCQNESIEQNTSVNCQNCVFSTKRVIVNQYVDWCSHNQSQKEITKQTVPCSHFLKRKNHTESTHVSTPRTNETTAKKVNTDELDKRELAYEAGKALQRLMKKKDIESEVSIIQAFLEPIVNNEKEKAYKEKLHISSSFNHFVPSKEISKVIHVLNNSIHHYQSALEDIRIYQRTENDILHAFELTDLSEEELFEYTKELQKIRIYRRQAKNFVETIEPLYQFSLKNKDFIEELKKINGQIDKIKKDIDNRKYFVREETSLQKAFEEAKPLHARMNQIMK